MKTNVGVLFIVLNVLVCVLTLYSSSKAIMKVEFTPYNLHNNRVILGIQGIAWGLALFLTDIFEFSFIKKNWFKLRLTTVECFILGQEGPLYIHSWVL
jgi:hypothetical protein